MKNNFHWLQLCSYIVLLLETADLTAAVIVKLSDPLSSLPYRQLNITFIYEQMYKSSSILERLTSHSFLVQKEEGTAKLEINSCHNFQIQNRNQCKEFVRSSEMKKIRRIFKIILKKTDKLPLVGKM